MVVTDEPPSTKATLGSNSAHITARHDPRTDWVVSLCALDNLVKGAAGQAVQCANLLCGLDETAGSPPSAWRHEREEMSVTAPQGSSPPASMPASDLGDLDLAVVTTADGASCRRPASSRPTR